MMSRTEVDLRQLFDWPLEAGPQQRLTTLIHDLECGSAPRRRGRLLAPLAAAAAVLLVIAGLVALETRSGGSSGRSRQAAAASTATSVPDPFPVEPGYSYFPKRPVVGAWTAPLLDDSGSYSLAQDTGKVVVLNLWASWCSPCVTETPRLDLVYEAYRSKGVDVIGVDTKDNIANAKRVVTDNKIDYPNVVDADGSLAKQLWNVDGEDSLPIDSLPATVIIDKHGRMVAYRTGAITADVLSGILNQLLAES